MLPVDSDRFFVCMAIINTDSPGREVRAYCSLCSRKKTFHKGLFYFESTACFYCQILYSMINVVVYVSCMTHILC
jgi:hypothetical protein